MTQIIMTLDIDGNKSFNINLNLLDLIDLSSVSDKMEGILHEVLDYYETVISHELLENCDYKTIDMMQEYFAIEGHVDSQFSETFRDALRNFLKVVIT